MNEPAKKTALRMIPYGIYVLSTKGNDGKLSAATVNWVTQSSFSPPLLVVALKADSGTYFGVKESGRFILNVLGKGQQGSAFAFFKPVEVADGTISGEPYREGAGGVPLLPNAAASLECKVIQIVSQGDHHVVVGEVIEAHLHKSFEGRPDAAILEMKDLGDNVFYGG